MAAVTESLQNSWPLEAKGRLLSMENTAIHRGDSAEGLAAVTTTFRNPIFLYQTPTCARGDHRNDTLLLPIILAGDINARNAFFHYRRQALLRNTEDGLLFFPRVDLSARGDSFCMLQELVAMLVQEWDSRIEQRAKLLSDKVLAPLIPSLPGKRYPVRVLDIGSGVGLFTSRLVQRVCQSGALGNRLLELTLMDQLKAAPERFFRTPVLNRSLSRLDYVESDYLTGIQDFAKAIEPAFDLVLFLRILHNISNFRIGSVKESDEIQKNGRYNTDAELSDYYQALGEVIPSLMAKGCKRTGRIKCTWVPKREFNHDSLILPDGTSLIDTITRIGRMVVIEDGDLHPQALEEHLLKCNLDDITVHDLSERLRLSTNHVYLLTRGGIDEHLGGKQLWRN